MADLIALQRKATEAREICQMWAMTNTYGKTAEELVEIELGYRRAQMALRKAEFELTVALDREIANA